MKYTRRLFVTALAIFALVITLVPIAHAQTALSDEQRTLIRSNCVAIKNTMTQLRATDALLRVNRGQTYESLSSRYMTRFNARLGANSLDNKGLVTITSSYEDRLNEFRRSYDVYSRQLSDAIAIDCQKDPDGFHYAVQNARDKRTELHESVQRLHSAIDDYRDAVSAFRTNYERISGEE